MFCFHKAYFQNIIHVLSDNSRADTGVTFYRILYSLSHSVTLCLAFSLQPYPHSVTGPQPFVGNINKFLYIKFQCYLSIVVEVMFSWN